MSDSPTVPTPSAVSESDFLNRLSSFRDLRERLERSILPLATSVDGSTFEFQASLHNLTLRAGSFVALESGGTVRLGQITDLRVRRETADLRGMGMASVSEIQLRAAQGTGVVLEADGRAFHDAAVSTASPDDIAAWYAERLRGRADITIGELQSAPGVPARLDGGGLGRHTFMCGQSGSGKTYSLGVLLERVLAETSLHVVILDPNSDYVGLPRLREGADPGRAERYSEVVGGIAVWGHDEKATRPLRMAFADLDPRVQGAALSIDPIRDRDEYAALEDLLHKRGPGQRLVTEVESFQESDDPEIRALGRRAGNLGVLSWKVWDPTARSLVEELRNPTSTCTVVDLGSLPTAAEQRLVAATVLSTLWQSRAARRPTLIVVDEAHNICPAQPGDPLTEVSTQHAIQIAAEGRKYGLYLLTSTQRPHKVHENVVSQCDNLLLMRMNSESDLVELHRLLSFVPAGLMAAATSFRMGQALVAGKIMAREAFVQMGDRLTEEGGGDIPTTWASRTVS